MTSSHQNEASKLRYPFNSSPKSVVPGLEISICRAPNRITNSKIESPISAANRIERLSRIIKENGRGRCKPQPINKAVKIPIYPQSINFVGLSVATDAWLYAAVIAIQWVDCIGTIYSSVWIDFRRFWCKISIVGF